MSHLDRRFVIAALLGMPLSSTVANAQSFDFEKMARDIFGQQVGNQSLSNTDAAAGIRAALEKGITTAVQTVGRTGGFWDDDQIRIPLPNTLEDIQSSLSRFGMSGMVDEIELQLNRGAEKAAPYALDIFLDAIMALTITDAVNIVQGAPNAATNFLKGQTLPKLTAAFTPIISDALSTTGAYTLVDDLSGQLSGIPFAPNLTSDAKQNLTEKGVEGGLNGLFHYVGEQEAAIRTNSAARSSDILRRVFGG